MDIPIQQSKRVTLRKHIRTVVIVLMLLSMAYASAKWFDEALPSLAEKDLWISEVKQGQLVRKVRGVGVLVPSEIRWIAAESAGRVERVLVKPGAMVSKETIIAELSNPQLHNQFQQAKWELEAAEANLLALQAQMQEQTLEQELFVAQAEMSLESAILREQAEQPLATKNIISDLDFASTKLQTKQSRVILDIRLQTQKRRAEVILAKLTAEEAKVRMFKNMLKLYQTQIDGLHVSSDIEGILQQVPVEVGQRVDIGSNIARVARPDSLLAELQVQENLVQELQIGLPVTIDTRNGLVTGKVARIDPRVQNGNVQVDVELISDLPMGARPDLSVTGSIIVERIDNTLYIDRPAGAVALSNTNLFKLNKNDQSAQIHKVQLGKASISTIQILAGLQEGDQVVVSDMSEYDQFSAIKIVKQ